MKRLYAAKGDSGEERDGGSEVSGVKPPRRCEVDRPASTRNGCRLRPSLLCAYLAGAVLIGLLGNALFGAWWLDPVVGLLIAGLAIQEGREAWQGDACC